MLLRCSPLILTEVVPTKSGNWFVSLKEEQRQFGATNSAKPCTDKARHHAHGTATVISAHVQGQQLSTQESCPCGSDVESARKQVCETGLHQNQPYRLATSIAKKVAKAKQEAEVKSMLMEQLGANVGRTARRLAGTIEDRNK